MTWYGMLKDATGWDGMLRDGMLQDATDRMVWDGDAHFHVEELDGDVPVPVARMHCRESTRTNLVAEPEKGKL